MKIAFLNPVIVTCVMLTSLVTVAQESEPMPANFCGSQVPTQQWEAHFQKFIIENKLQNTANKGQTPLYTIPVIMHVIHGGQAVGTYPNLAQGQLVSQIQVLNNDFGGIGHNSGVYPVQAFATWANNNAIPSNNLDAFGRIKIANCFIQFCLATHDTLGNLLAEPGINRINYLTMGWQNPASFSTYTSFKNFIDATVKAQTIWNVSKYMNIWVTDENVNAVGLLGYATFPPFAGLQGLQGFGGTNTTDGFWCYARAFGSVDEYPLGTYTGSNNRGRISSHEIGHYLGLRHIWGDGACANDYCDDTPPASAQNFNSPSYPLKVTACSGNSPDGEMFMNIMDYTNDIAKYMFTEDQATRMQTAMASSPYRKFLGTHNLCSITPIAATSQFAIPTGSCGSSAIITVTNQAKGTPLPTYTWNVTGSAFISPNINSQFAAISFPSPGIYTITLATDNGTLSTTTKTLGIYAFPNVSISGSATLVCQGAVVTLSASGGNTYTWNPGAVLGSSYTFTATTNKTFSCIATGPGNCKSTGFFPVATQICTGMQSTVSVRELQIYPNPAADHLYVETGASAAAKFFVYDITGRVVMDVKAQQKDEAEILNTSHLLPGVYLLKIVLEKGTTQSVRFIKQ